MAKIHSHTEKSILNLVKSGQIQIVFTLSRLIWHQSKFRIFLLVTNQSEKCDYTPALVCINAIEGTFLYVQDSDSLDIYDI